MIEIESWKIIVSLILSAIWGFVLKIYIDKIRSSD